MFLSDDAKTQRARHLALAGAGILGVLSSHAAYAQEGAANAGDTSWVLTSAALVLLMTPGLALFYGGMVRTKNALSTMYQSFMAIAVVALVWAIVGYSLMFAPDMGGGIIGGFDHVLLSGVDQNVKEGLTIPHMAFMVFQAMFAVITPALITGAFAERVRTKAWIPFMALWSVCVYSVVGHWVWGPGGWIAGAGGLDFAGGLVVHMTAGFSALAATYAIAPRRNWNSSSERVYNPGLILLGTGMLLFGWFGFNGGSALASNGLASHAFATTFFAAAAATVGWTIVDNFRTGKMSVVGSAIGCVAGLVIITPAAGYVTIPAALAMGFIGSMVCNFAAVIVKSRFNRDDTLDVFACHGVGGLFGVICTGLFATKTVNPAGADGLFAGNPDLLVGNLQGAAAVAIFSFVATIILIKFVNMFARVRLDDREEIEGLDMTQHGELVTSDTTTVPGNMPPENVKEFRKAS
jgi:Amt family ammonium transporter